MAKGCRPPLPDESVHEILRLAQRHMPLARIAGRFDRDPRTISDIVAGKRYRHITAPGHKADGPCDCVRCQFIHRQDENVGLAALAMAEFACLLCDGDVVTQVLAVAKHHGHVVCAKCEGRKAK